MWKADDKFMRDFFGMPSACCNDPKVVLIKDLLALSCAMSHYAKLLPNQPPKEHRNVR